MKCLFLLLTFALGATAAERIPNSLWKGTNASFIVHMAMKPDGTNLGGGKVIFRGPRDNPRGHPATFWRGSDGWVTADYGASARGERIVQFKIINRSARTITARTDNTDTILTNVPPETFTLHRVK